MGTFESRLRWSQRWRWLAPALFLVAVAVAVGIFALRETSVDSRARRAHERALQLALADDVASLEQARSELDEALVASPRLHAAAADRALVDLLLAGSLAELPDGNGDQQARRERAKALVGGASDALEKLRRASLARSEVARARAIAASFGASRSELRKLATAAVGEMPGEPWVLVAEASVDLGSSDRVVRDRALADVTGLVARRPDVLRARYVLARGQALAGQRNEALTTLEGLLKANPKHEGALALRESIVRPPPGAPIASPGTVGAPAEVQRAEKPSPALRKPDSTAGEVGATPRSLRPTAATPSPSPKERPPAVVPAPAEPAAVGGGEPSPPPEPSPAPRLRPAAVPEPEPVGDGE